jgi:hypothetical protein
MPVLGKASLPIQAMAAAAFSFMAIWHTITYLSEVSKPL